MRETMALSGLQLKVLRDSLVRAFDWTSLDMLLSDHLNKRLEDIAGSGPFNSLVIKVIDAAEMEGWTKDLIAAAQLERPDNPDIRELMSRLNLFDISGSKHQVHQPLERIVKAGVPFIDPAAFVAKLDQLRRVICRIEDLRDPRQSLGTGFLVNRDLVLTSYHVVEQYINPKHNRVRDTNGLRCRFDYAVENDGQIIPGTAELLATGNEWIAHYSKYSEFDAGDQTGLPQINELDFALLRLGGAIGDAPAPDGKKRGWVTVSTRSPLPRSADANLILQYPKDASLKLVFAKVIDLNDNSTRVRYDTNTEAGSSGSPCFDITLTLVALYQGGDPSYQRTAFNQAIPIDRIVSHLATQSSVPQFWI
jgi:hypothetical protein